MPLEDLINGKVADMFRLAGLANVEAEETHGRKRHDIRVTLDDGIVILEADIGSRRGAIIDADARLAQHATVLAFAVCYEEGQRYEDVTLDTPLSWTLRTSDVNSGKAREGQAGDKDWSRGTVRDLAEAVKQAPEHIDDADMAAGQLLVALDKAARDIPPDTRQRLADVLGIPAPKGNKPSELDSDYFKRTKRAALVLATSMLFQHRLNQNIVPGWRNPTECARDDDPVSAFRDVWDAILAIDYQPIFQTAQLALSALPATVDANRIVSELALDVGRVARSMRGMRHDLLGRVFHRVLDTARYDGSFYTSPAAATLLAALALPRSLKGEWDHDAIEQMRVCDPACGTGTLLMATVERLNQLKRGDTELDAELDELLAEALVEKVIYGYDTNLTATHMTASTLGMIRPRTQFDRMHVNQTPFGVFDDPDGGGKKVARIGSLEFLHGEGMLLKPWPSARNVGGEQWRREPPPPMDLVIMNPPFTRDSLRHDQMGADAEALMKEREKQLMKDKEYRTAAPLSASANAFLILGEDMVKEDGTLAAVAPLAIATNPVALDTRRYLADTFHIDTVVSSHDPKRIFFSENTNIGEVLIIARRWSGTGEKPRTRFVNLARNPRTSYEASDLARALENDESGEFTVQRVDAARVASGDWYAVNFYAPWLGSAYREMAANLVRLDAIAEVGPFGRRIRDTYRKFEQPTDSGRRALWHHKTDVTTSMHAETDVFIEPIKGKERLADQYWEQRSRLLLPHNLYLPSARVVTTMLDERTVGSIWTPCRPRDDETAAAICVWFNSTPGVLSMLAERDNKKPPYPQFSLDALRSMRVPDFPSLPEARDALATAYEELKDQQLRPLPEIAHDSVRMRLDDIVGDALGFEREWVARVRKALGEEPSITNRPLYADAEAKQEGLL